MNHAALTKLVHLGTRESGDVDSHKLSLVKRLSITLALIFKGMISVRILRIAFRKITHGVFLCLLNFLCKFTFIMDYVLYLSRNQYLRLIKLIIVIV